MSKMQGLRRREICDDRLFLLPIAVLTLTKRTLITPFFRLGIRK
ncbi:MAG: hypothetical protein NTU59_03750 [Coprothermobacterota bacterium]|nr:hypothetical protein [Coprothermobacterota bacterium]